MPLHIRGECCKCNGTFYFDIWSISRNHKYFNEYIRVCDHFDVEIDHESSIGFLGWGWSNHIKLYAFYKQNNEKQIIINETFSKGDTESEKYKIFSNKIVFRARVSDYRYNYPTCGMDIQERLDYEEIREQQKLEQQRRQEEENKRKQIEASIDNIMEKNKLSEETKNSLMELESICIEIKTTTTSELLLDDITKEKSIREEFQTYKECEMIKTT
jgi:hypothetical protein